MAHQYKSAGDGATPGSAAQTGTSSLDQAHNVRAAEASSIAAEELADSIATLRAMLHQIRFVAEATDSHLENFRGSVPNREDMLASCGLIGHLTRQALDQLATLEAEVSHA